MLTRIYADNFKALVNFEFRPGGLNLLMGQNGSGKTSVFDVLLRIKDLVLLGFPAADVFAHTRTRWDRRDLQSFEIEIDRGGGVFRYRLEIEQPPKSVEKASIRTESLTFDGATLYRYSGGEAQLFHEGNEPPVVFPFAPDRSFLQNVDAVRSPKLSHLAEFKSFLAGLWILQPNPFAMAPLAEHEQPFLAADGKNLASYFNFLNNERPEVRAQLEDALKHALPGFLRFSFRRLGDKKLFLTAFDFEASGEATELGLAELSEGQRVLILLYAAVLGLAQSGGLVCFDEPDNFVSLVEIQPWLQLLRDTIDSRGGQAMVISHHPEVMDYLALDSVWHLDRPSGPVRVRELDPRPAADVEALKLSELVARGI